MARKRNSRKSGPRERRITVRSVRRDPPDIRKLSRALIALAQAEAEQQAQAQVAANTDPPAPSAQLEQTDADERGAA